MVVYLFFLVGGEPKKTMAAGAPGVISTPVRFLKGVYIYNIYIYTKSRATLDYIGILAHLLRMVMEPKYI